MRKRICFIDDSEFELALFQNAFGKLFEIIVAKEWEDCEKLIEDRWGEKPDLFVLDLYFPHAAPDDGLLQSLKSFSPPYVPDDGNLTQATLNYAAAEKRLIHVLRALGQTPQGGLDLAATIRGSRKHSGVPMVFYSRNPTAEDYVRCMREKGVLTLIPKPTGDTERETEELTKKLCGSIGKKFTIAMDSTSARAKLKLARIANQAVELLLKPFFKELAKQGAASLYR